jgi:hypothetical protein
MTVYYLDFENGNDANTGLSFAQRWKTLTAGATAARIAPGDEIRIMASPLQSSIGSATWTDNSDTVVLAAPVTQDIDDGSVLWTAAANVSTSISTTNYREGTQAANISVTATFTTGRCAHRATGLLDLSAYQQISFWVRLSASLASMFELRLCTDTAGATAVHTIPIPALAGSNWYRVTWNNNAPLNAAIQSVALYAVADPSTVAVVLDNIIACKAAASADSLTLDSLIAPTSDNDGPWYSIQSIRGTTVKLGTHVAAPAGATGKYAVIQARSDCRCSANVSRCRHAGRRNRLYVRLGSYRHVNAQRRDMVATEQRAARHVGYCARHVHGDRLDNSLHACRWHVLRQPQRLCFRLCRERCG